MQAGKAANDAATTTTREKFVPGNIPEEMRRRPQWVVWKEERRDGKPTKVPYVAGGAGKASSTDPRTWRSFEEAAQAHRTGRYDGIAFVFAEDDPYAGVDLDGCRNPETGEIASWALEIVEQLDSYTEISPSGAGVHIILRGNLPPGRRGWGDGHGLYDSGRYFTITGNRLAGAPAKIEARQVELLVLHRKLFPPKEVVARAKPETVTGAEKISDAEVIRLAGTHNREKFEPLFWRGDWEGLYESQSEADCALCEIIGFYAGPDHERIERIFGLSPLGQREKWETRPKYRRDTIEKALSGKTDFYSPSARKDRHGGVNKEFEELVRGDLLGGERPANMPFNTTDMGNAERFAARHGEDLRYVHPWRKWLFWTGSGFAVDDIGEVGRLAKDTTRGIYGESEKPEYAELRTALARHAIQSEARARVVAMVALAQSERGIPVRPDELDADPWLLNVKNGTIDLRTGELREHRREDLITKLAPVEYDPDAAAPAWAAFLERVLPGEELGGFIQRAVGYSLTGDTSEQSMFINHGAGNNGKSTFQEALAAALGDYAMRAPTEMLMVRRTGGVPNDVARLKGARFVTASETEEGRRLAESLVKDLTGQDTITARFMRAEFFDFKPTHKLWLSTNHKPEIRGTDNAIWRRIRLVPFNVRIGDDEIDRELPEKLRAELPGILAWAVRGCLDWQRRGGLGEPDEVREATEDYRAEMDVLASFIDDCCAVYPEARATSKALYEAYTTWCEENRESADKKRNFGARLRERGFERARGTGNVHVRLGIALRTDREPDPDGGSDPTGGKGHPEKSPKNGAFQGSGSDLSDPSGPKTGMNNENGSHEEPNPESGSLRSLGSLGPCNKYAGEGKGLSVEEVGEETRRAGSGPAKALAVYLEKPSEQRLEYLTRAVLHARGLSSEGWERHAGAVGEAAGDPGNHPLDCGCEGCS